MDLIYCVEDDEGIRDLITYAVKSAGFEAEGFESASDFEKRLGERLPSMVLLEQVQTVNKEDLKDYIGTVDDEQLIRRINTMLKKTFGLWIYKKEKEENIRCLCPKCLSEYIDNPNYIVRRLDPFAKEKDRCDKCDKAGWDYVVTERSSVRKGKSGSYEK